MSPLPLLSQLLEAPPAGAWEAIACELTRQWSATTPAPANNRYKTDIYRREMDETLPLDNFLATVGWDLWDHFDSTIPKTSAEVGHFWRKYRGGTAVLVLDGLSLRELPLLLAGAEGQGIKIESVKITASELPGDTTPFARALGLNQGRSQLRGTAFTPHSPFYPGKGESVDLPFDDCANLVDATPNWLFWHQWPDTRLHALSTQGRGFDFFLEEMWSRFQEPPLWNFVRRLATGRRVAITSDHGYANAGLFQDARGEEASWLKENLKGNRHAAGAAISHRENTAVFVPPLGVSVKNSHGENFLALGRRKWKVPGGYPTLTHGGLTLLEVFSPFVEVSL